MTVKSWYYHSFIFTILLALLSGCSNSDTTSGKSVSSNDLPLVSDSPTLDPLSSACAQSGKSPVIDWLTEATYGTNQPILIVGSNFIPPTQVTIGTNSGSIINETNDQVTIDQPTNLFANCKSVLCEIPLTLHNSNGCEASTKLVAKKVLQPLENTFSGDLPSELLGLSLDNIGDIDGDGHDDIVAISANNVRLLSVGKSPLIPESILWKKSAGSISCSLSATNYTRISAAGDVDGDGRMDVLVSQPLDNVATGKVCVLSGKNGDELFSLSGSKQYEYFGFGLARGWDSNGDGSSDFFVSTPYYGAQATGRVYLYSGKTGTVMRTWDGEADFENFGYAIKNLGDINGDGKDDIAVNADGYKNNAADNVGAVFILSGIAIFSVTHTSAPKIEGETINNFGEALAGIDDLNGDGIRDILIGASKWAGSFYAFSGANFAKLFQVDNPDPTSNNDWFGGAIASAGDFDGDGIEDIVVGASGSSHNAGRVYVFSGADQKILLKRQGFSNDDRLGLAVARAGDSNHDGFADIVASAPYNKANVVWEGSIYITNQSNVIGP